jgi:hypothetical protein
MKLLWTKRNNFGSKLIEWGTDGDCSHFAVVFDDKPGGYGLVFHSHIQGVGLDWFGSFVEHYQIVHCLQPKYPINEETVYQSLVSRFCGKEYDQLAFIYFGLCLAAHKLWGLKVPLHNQWGDKNLPLCTEIAAALQDCGIIGLPDL